MLKMKTNCCTTIPEINHVLIFSGNKCSTLLLVHSAVHRTYMCSRSTYYVVVPLNTHSILKYHYPLILYVTNIYAGILMAEPHPASLQRPVLCFAQLLCLMLPVGGSHPDCVQRPTNDILRNHCNRRRSCITWASIFHLLCMFFIEVVDLYIFVQVMDLRCRICNKQGADMGAP